MARGHRPRASFGDIISFHGARHLAPEPQVLPGKLAADDGEIAKIVGHLQLQLMERIFLQP